MITKAQQLLSLLDEDNSTHVLQDAEIDEIPRSEDDKANQWKTNSDIYPQRDVKNKLTINVAK